MHNHCSASVSRFLLVLGKPHAHLFTFASTFSYSSRTPEEASACVSVCSRLIISKYLLTHLTTRCQMSSKIIPF